jgi:hypothetical protein
LAVLVATLIVFLVALVTAGWKAALFMLLLGVIMDPFWVLGSIAGLGFEGFKAWGKRDLEKADREVEAFYREHPELAHRRRSQVGDVENRENS